MRTFILCSAASPSSSSSSSEESSPRETLPGEAARPDPSASSPKVPSSCTARHMSPHLLHSLVEIGRVVTPEFATKPDSLPHSLNLDWNVRTSTQSADVPWLSVTSISYAGASVQPVL